MATGAKRGRKPVPAGQKRRKTGWLPISDDELDRARKAADRSGKPLATFCREAINSAADQVLRDKPRGKSKVATMLDQAGI